MGVVQIELRTLLLKLLLEYHILRMQLIDQILLFAVHPSHQRGQENRELRLQHATFHLSAVFGISIDSLV